MNRGVTELRVIEGENNLFDTDETYIIPLYQRAFAWEDRHLVQLIDDICGAAEGANYYIGTLIVSRQGNRCEVVDGQQRLTALYLLLNCLGEKVEETLTFACREKSNYTLRHIGAYLSEDKAGFDLSRAEDSLLKGIDAIRERLSHRDISGAELISRLRRVVLYRVEVPPHTDLNHYFEIMNTRGEQLEQHDILKADLMSALKEEWERQVFAKIWEACSDMTGYVQMHFTGRGGEDRRFLFGNEWNKMLHDRWEEYHTNELCGEQQKDSMKIKDLIKRSYDPGVVQSDAGDEDQARFESIIEFPYFLLHTLKVFIQCQGFRHEDGVSALMPEQLDDKKLTECFKNVIDNGVTADGRRIQDCKGQFSADFIVCLLRTRFLFDKYIIKREYTNGSPEGAWSLKSLKAARRNSGASASYQNTWFGRYREWDQTVRRRHQPNLMIQAALRVSYTSPRAMHWITRLLLWLSQPHENGLADFGGEAEKIAKEAVRDNFLNVYGKGDQAPGADTPHIVFNYLDYLLWKKYPKYKDFVFEFRNSVEHWYPQNPSEGTFESWSDVDQFGNLCILQRRINSKFSNLSPEAKKATFEDTIKKGSLKLRLMSDLTEGDGVKTASQLWRDTLCQQHGEDMLQLLREACGCEG